MEKIGMFLIISILLICANFIVGLACERSGYKNTGQGLFEQRHKKP
jgi:hypothetical protein